MEQVTKQQYDEKWDLMSVSTKNPKEVHEALELGFEPFAVTNQMLKVENPIVTGGVMDQGRMVMETYMWFKRKIYVPVKETVSAE